MWSHESIMHRTPNVLQPILAQFRAIWNQCCQTHNWADTGGFTFLDTSARSKTPQSSCKFQCKDCGSPLAGSIYSENEMGLGRAGPAGSALASQSWDPNPQRVFCSVHWPWGESGGQEGVGCNQLCLFGAIPAAHHPHVIGALSSS